MTNGLGLGKLGEGPLGGGYYPTSPVPSYSYTEEIEFRNLISQFENGAEQRRKKWSRGKHVFTLIYKALTQAELISLWDFYLTMNGSFESFWYKDLNLMNGGISLINTTPTDGGSGYAANDILTVTSEGFNGTVKVLTVNGSGVIQTLQTAPVTPGIGYKTGSGKTTIGGTESGATINITSIKNNIYKVRFLEDKMSYEMFSYQIMKSGLKFIEVF